MKLSSEQIFSAAQGAVRMEETETGLRLCRLTEEEQAVYVPTIRDSRARASADIRLEFDTDADSLTLSVTTLVSTSLKYFAFEIYKNGERIGFLRNFGDEAENTAFVSGKYELGEHSGVYPLGDGVKRIRILFPQTVIADIREMTLENASVFTPVVRKRKILMYGDSITHGCDALYPSEMYTARIGDAFGAHILNKGVGGERFNPALAACPSDFKPDFITSAYGTNDWAGESRETLLDKCPRYHAILAEKYPDTPIFVLSPIWRTDTERERPFGPFEAVADFIRETIAPYPNMHFVYGLDLMPHEKRYYGDGCIHPNGAGFAYLAENLLKEIRKYGIG